MVINVGGVATWYPSEVRFSQINKYLDGRNVVRELLDAYRVNTPKGKSRIF